MAGDTNDIDTVWRWLSHSENSIFLLDGLNNLKDLLIPTKNEMPPSENSDFFLKTGGEDIPRLEKIIHGKILNLLRKYNF